MSEKKIPNRKEGKFNLLEESCKQLRNNNTLPPELVEKMAEAWSQPNSVQSCAQIAVDYSEPFQLEIGLLEMDNDLLEQDIVRIKQQRDELIDFVKFIEDNFDDFLKHTNLAKSYHTGLNFQFMNELPGKTKQLLKKHEDGKE